jgi:outer membrane protein OmpA-like peptidoglycan-associated protein
LQAKETFNELKVRIMKSLKSIAVALCAALVLAGCGMSKTGQGALIGAGGGAALGAVIGALAGNAAIGTAIGGAVGAGAGAIIGKKMDKAKKEAEAIQNAQVEEVTDANGLEAVKMTFDSGILFSTGKSELTPASKASLQQLATVLKNNSDCDVAIQGYTDNQGWKNSTAEQSAQKNQALSLDRATSVSSYLMALSVPASQIKSVEGLGEANPVASNATKDGQAQNRRVEVYMYASQKMIQDANAQAAQ